MSYLYIRISSSSIFFGEEGEYYIIPESTFLKAGWVTGCGFDCFKGRKLMNRQLSCDRLECIYGFLVSKETVVLCRWGRSKQKFGFIKRVDKC